MSTIKVTNVQDTSGGSSSTSAEIFKGRAKAWVNFDGAVSSPSINDDFNVASITDNGTGQYTINFSNALPTANYVVAGTGTWSTLSWGLHVTVDGSTITTSSFKIHTVYTNSSNFNNTDCKIAMVVVFCDT
jgi:hypothetical protein